MTIRTATTALLGLALAMPADAGLCTPEEIDYFSCTAGKRQIALCGSPAVAEDHGYIEFRLQEGAAKVQAFPKTRRPPRGVLTKDFVVWGKSGFETTVHVQADTLAYVLYANLMVGSAESMAADRTGIYGYHAGVRIYRNDALASDLECDRGDATAIDPRRLDQELPDFIDASRQ